VTQQQAAAAQRADQVVCRRHGGTGCGQWQQAAEIGAARISESSSGAAAAASSVARISTMALDRPQGRCAC
jgi:hypothetical protein